MGGSWSNSVGLPEHQTDLALWALRWVPTVVPRLWRYDATIKWTSEQDKRTSAQAHNRMFRGSAWWVHMPTRYKRRFFHLWFIVKNVLNFFDSKLSLRSTLVSGPVKLQAPRTLQTKAPATPGLTHHPCLVVLLCHRSLTRLSIIIIHKYWCIGVSEVQAAKHSSK